MTFFQVLNAFNGYLERESERTKVLKILTWESTRWMTWKLWNIGVDKKYRVKDPSKLLKFDWEDQPKQLTPEEQKQIVDFFPDKPRHGNK